ncbi:MgtC/SapB family protein [Catenulispora sp. NF23]|uniref:MgtC/SapB family protein n=1 Tax=Catenulispora pinistramenti TaxID=2705254 RepID=A0ABS5KWZ2_9ACTN|nr:MgtC/SapB family protein [Catenulispora pinistramenti]MBS2534092.1 MgtC/SapB family protein [Catenulispora pinistramenti]MBS2550587.1 MgtC/SapB family protein [Catenulispora pinistramenti]
MSTSILWEEPTGQGWTQVGELAVALVLSSAIGLEREIRQKAAGLRTYTIVGLGAALFVLVSKYGFTDVLSPGRVVVDPSRVAAQIVSGLGFIGGGVIFMRRDTVRGLTTAAALWLTAGVGAAAGAGLGLLALLTTVGYFVVAYALRPLTHWMPALRTPPVTYRIEYLDGRGLLRTVLDVCTGAGFFVASFSGTGRHDHSDSRDLEAPQGAQAPEAGRLDRTVEVVLTLHGRGNVNDLTEQLVATSGIVAVAYNRADDEFS